MIVVVTSISANGGDIMEPRITKLRPRSGICYHWAKSQLTTACASNQTGMVHLWDAILLMTRVLKIPLEAAGPLFVAAADFQMRTSSQMGFEALEILCVLLHIMEPYVNGFRYQSSFNDHCHLRQPHRCSRSDCCLHFSSMNYKMNGSISCNENASSSQVEPLVKQPQYILNLNESQFTEIEQRLSADVGPEVTSNSMSAPRSPWELGYTVNIDVSAVAVVRKKVAYVENIDEPWVVHFCPNYIEVLTSSLKSQIAGQSEFEMELFDAAIRRYKQLDDALYSSECHLRWRHFVESDFMVSLVAGWFDIADPIVCSHFYSKHIDYVVTSCEIIFFPVLLQHRWVCFAWRMKDNTIVVYDPLSTRVGFFAFISVDVSMASACSRHLQRVCWKTGLPWSLVMSRRYLAILPQLFGWALTMFFRLSISHSWYIVAFGFWCGISSSFPVLFLLQPTSLCQPPLCICLHQCSCVYVNPDRGLKMSLACWP